MRTRSSSAWFQYHSCFSKCYSFTGLFFYIQCVCEEDCDVWPPLMLHISKIYAVFFIRDKLRKQVIFSVSHILLHSLKHFYMRVNVSIVLLYWLWGFLISKGHCLWVMFIRKLNVCTCACMKCACIFISVECGGGRQCPLCFIRSAP